MTVVAHYVERWLDLSASFVAAHVEASRHPAVVLSRDGWENLEAFDHHPRHLVGGVRNRAPEPLKPLVLRAHLSAVLAARRVDLVHVHFGYAANDAVAVTRHRPLVLSLHGHDATALVREDPRRYQPVVAAVDAVVVPSRFLADAATAAGFPSDRVHVIPAGVDTRFFTRSPLPAGPPVIGFVGRLVAKKGIDVLARAWPQIRAAVPEARLHVLGDGPLRHLVPATDAGVVHELPDPRRRAEQARDVIRGATIVVTPSHPAPDGDSESLLLVNLEAAAAGRPVVSTHHGGIPEYVVDGRTGRLVAPGEPAPFAAAVIDLLRDPVAREALAAAGPPHAARFDRRACTARVDDLYDALLGDRLRRK